MYLGHVTTTICLHQCLEQLKVRLPVLPFFLGALFPDLADKPLAWATDLPSRGIFHSSVVLIILFCVFTVFLPKKRALTNSFFAGMLLHVIQDIPADPQNLFWPLLGPFQYQDRPPLFVSLWQYYVEIRLPIHWTVELISLPWFLAILWKNGKSPYKRSAVQ